MAQLRRGQTYADLAGGFGIGPTSGQPIEFACGKPHVILDGTLLRIDRVGMTVGRDRPSTRADTRATG